MPKLAAPLILLILLFVLFVSNFAVGNYQTYLASNVSPTKTPIPNSSAEVESVTLDKEVATIFCPWPEDFPMKHHCSEDKQKIKVTTKANMPENNNFTYYYMVSGGHIIGQGANVIWELVGRPGKYTITVGLGKDNVIQGKTITKTVQLEDCDNCDLPPPPCACPTLSIIGPGKSVRNGDLIIFEAKTEGGTQKFLEYKWTISGGTMITGQGTSRLLVKTTAKDSDSVTAKVEISGGGLCDTCLREMSKSVPVTSK
jgi:hypothetical protein